MPAIADAPIPAPAAVPVVPAPAAAVVLDAMFGKPGAPGAATPAPPAPVVPAPDTAVSAPAATPPVATPATPDAAKSATEAVPEPRSLLAGDAPTPKPADAKAPEAAKPDAKADAPAAPTYTLALPKETALTATDLADIQKAATELGLSEKQATALLAREDKRAVAARESITTSQKADYTKLFTTLETQMKSDKDFGGQHLKATLDNANRALRTHFDPEFVAALQKTPFGSHPGLLRGLARIGMGLREDTPPNQSTPGGTSVAELPPHVRAFPDMYPQLFPKT